jgi:hypothetical protein
VLVAFLCAGPVAAQAQVIIEELSDDEDAADSGAKPANGKDGADAPRGQPTFALLRGQAIVGTLAEKRLTVLTRYGRLEVPFEEIVRVRFRPRLSKEDAERFHRLLAALRADPAKESTAAAIRDLGAGCYLAILAAAKKPENQPVQDALAKLQGEIEALEDVYLDPQDEVVTQRFTMKGDVVEEVLHVERGALRLAVPVSDISHIAYGEMVVRKLWKVSSQHMEGNGGFLDTGFKVKKGQKFALIPTGQMTWQGQSFGPGGISNHTWNGRRMGCLQWRIGTGAWQVLGGNFEGKAESAGTLQFCVHLTSDAADGEFKIEFKQSKK